MEQINYPVLAQWDITTACNFSCSFCLSNSGPKSEFDLDLFKAKMIVDKLYDGGVLFLRVLGGEPFFRNDIQDVLGYAVNKGMIISFSTNAALITDSHASFIKSIEPSINYFQISLYGVDSNSYDSCVKNPSGFDLVEKGISTLKKHDLHPYAFWVLTAENVNYLEDAYQLVSKWDLPALRISPKLNLGRAEGDVERGDHKAFWRDAIEMLTKLESRVRTGSRPSVQLHARPMLGEFLYHKTNLGYFYISCKAASTMVYIDSKGNASPCPFSDFMPSSYKKDFVEDRKMNLLESTLPVIWESDIFRKYREMQKPGVGKKNTECPHFKSMICNPCIYTPCTCSDTIKIINSALNGTSQA